MHFINQEFFLTLIMLMGVFSTPRRIFLIAVLWKIGISQNPLVTFPRYMSHRIQHSQSDDR